MNSKGQFSIIAALLVAFILIGTLFAVYAMIRYDSSSSQSPQVLTATDETNSAILKALGFTVGYYGSELQVTGNQTFADDNATAYMNNALQYIESMNPSWGESIDMKSLNLETNWFSNPSISSGQLSVVYDLTNLGINGIDYSASCSLGVQIFSSPESNQVCLNVTQDSTEPLTSLGQQNFAFYVYNYSTSNWQLENPTLTPIVFTNGTYLINTPPGIDDSAFMVQVTDSRGIMVEASSYNSYNLDFSFGSQSMTQNSPVIVQLLQNGTMQTFGQDLVNTTQALPIPPVAVKCLNLCQTGSTSDIPFQVEDWISNYQIPLGLTSNYTIFGNSQMIVFEVSPSASQLTLWWNGSDTAIQSSKAYTDTYFSNDNYENGYLSNGLLSLQFTSSSNGYIPPITSTVGSVTSTANFMRIDADLGGYGSGFGFIIQHGVVRDIVQGEAEWSGGIPNCPNVYSQIVITLPANANYYTYQLRLIFINSSITRSITDISPIQLSTTISQPQAVTENGVFSNGTSNVSYGNGIFNNATGSAHHWSEIINSEQQGTGIMFTSSENQQLYAFDSMTNPHAYTGALKANAAATPQVIELDPVTSAGTVSFSSPMDITWYGAVATFNGVNPIYNITGTSGLWSLVEQPPTVAITLGSLNVPSINISPSADATGTTITVSGGGFLPDSPITITYDGQVVVTPAPISTEYGAIPSGTTFEAPASQLGPNTITASTGSSSATATYTVTASPMETVTFEQTGISSDAGSAPILTIDSKSYSYSSLPISFVWAEGSTHSISASNSPIAIGTAKQYVWESWSDGGAQSQSYTVPASSSTVTANFACQYKVTFNYQVSGGSASPAPTVTYYSLGSPETVTAGSSATVWVDTGTTYTYTNPLMGSGSTERWDTSTPSNSVSTATTIDPTYVNQYLITFGYSDQDSSAITSGTQIGSYYQFGSSEAITTGSAYGVTTPASNWVDAGSMVTYQTFTSGTQRWALPSSSTSFTANSATTAPGASYYHEYQITPYYTLSDSSSPTVSGVVNYMQFGSPATATPTKGTSGGTAVWADAGSAVKYTSPINGASGERWQVTSSDSGTYTKISSVTSSTSPSVEYFDQYGFQLAYTVSDGGSPTAPSLTSTQFGSSYKPTLTTSLVTYWLDSGKSWSVTNPLGGSGTSEQWESSQTISGTVGASSPTTSGTSLTFNYYNQYKFTLSYTVSDGGSGYSAPTLTATEFGQAYRQTLTGTATAYWLDSSQSWSVTNPLSGSSSSERWDTSQSSSGTVSTTQTTAYVYYNQYSFTLSYSVSGGSGYSVPTLTSKQFGSSYTPTLGTTGTQYWLDSGQSWSATNPLTGSGTTQRWETNQVASGTVGASSPTTAGNSLAFAYYNQDSITLSYSVTDGGSGYSSPSFTASQYGASTPQTLTTTATAYWFDAGASWTVTNPLGGSSGTERWYTSQATTGTVSSTTIAFAYYNQYQVTFAASSNVMTDSSATIVMVAGTGYNYAQLPYTNWFNAASLAYSYSSPIGSSSSSTTGYYWSSTSGLSQTLQSNTFTPSATGTITATYTATTFGIASNCEGFNSVSSGTTITTTSMTAQANELIMVVITGSSSSATVHSISDSFGTHLTYNSKLSSTKASQCLYVYYAETGAQTGSFTITVTMSASANFCVQAFGITGANTATPFDTNSNLPAINYGTSSSVPTVTGISTSNANDLLLAFEGQASSTAQTAGTGYTAPAGLLHNANSVGNNVEYQQVNSLQTSQSASFGTSVSSWIMAVVAVQRAW